jgi:hypothetical protein
MVSIIDYSSTSWFATQSLSLRLNMLFPLASRLVETRFHKSLLNVILHDETSEQNASSAPLLSLPKK